MILARSTRFASAILIAAVSVTSTRAQDRSATTASWFVPFVGVDQIESRGGYVAGLFRSSFGDRAIVIYKPGESEPIVRLDGRIGCRLAREEAPVAPSLSFDGRRVIYYPGTGRDVCSYDLATAKGGVLFTADVAALLPPGLAGSAVWVINKTANGVEAVRVKATASGEAERAASPDLGIKKLGGRVFSEEAVALTDAATGAINVWSGSGPWVRLEPPPSGRAVALTGGQLYAVVGGEMPKRLLRANPRGPASGWHEVLASSPAAHLVVVSAAGGASPGTLAVIEAPDSALGKPRPLKLHVVGSARVDTTELQPWEGWDNPRLFALDDRTLVRPERQQQRLALTFTSGFFDAKPSPATEPAPMPQAAPPTETPRAEVATPAPPLPRAGTPPTPKLPAPSAPAAPDRPGTPGRSAERAMAWLIRQLTPEFQTPWGPARLLASYEDDQEGGTGWIYDASITAIAFLSARRVDLACQLLAGLASLQEDEGAWQFAYDSKRRMALATPRHPGSIAWAVMAINYYEWETKDRRFAPVANKALQYLRRFISKEPGPTSGALSRGEPEPHDFSIEHNVDAYSAFFWRGTVEGNREHLRIADGVKNFVLGRLEVGDADGTSRFFKVGVRDPTLFLDAQSWTTLALAPAASGDAERRVFRDALDTACARLVERNGVLGSVTGIVGFNEHASVLANPKVWSEGTEGMVAALRVLARLTGDADLRRQADFYHGWTRQYQAASGGIPYATENIDGWSTRPSAAGTAWFLLNAIGQDRNPYHPASPITLGR